MLNRVNVPIKIYLLEALSGDSRLIKECLDVSKNLIFKLSKSNTLKNALKDLEEQNYDIIFLDLNLPDSKSINTAIEISKVAKEIPIIILTVFTKDYEEILSFKDIIFDYIDKDQLNNYNLIKTIRFAVERKKFFQKLHKTEKEWRIRFDSISDIVSIQDIERKIIQVNKAFKDAVQMEESELINTKCNEIIHYNCEQPENCPHSRVFLTKKPITEEIFEPKFNRYFLVTASPIVDDNGEINNIIHIMKDITKLKNIENELKESEEKFSISFQSSSALMAISTIEDGKFIEVNNRFLETLEYEKDDVIGKTSQELDLFVNYNDRKKVIEQMKEEGFVINAEIQMKTKYHNVVVGLFSANPIKLQGQEYLLTTMTDITERKEIEKRLIKSEEKYREAYNIARFYKDLFAHDMNNILQSIISTSDYYRFIKDDPEKLEQFGDISQIIKNHVKRGSLLISNVRKLSKLDEMEMSFKSIDVLSTLNKALNNVKNGFQARDLHIKFSGLSEHLKVLGNELLIDVFDNLLNNAVKYTHEKEKVNLEISISRIIEDEISYLKFEFIDNGRGIPDDKKAILFQRQTTDDQIERGMRMGLSLVKIIVNKYKGRIWVEDRIKGDYSKGSKFILMLEES